MSSPNQDTPGHWAKKFHLASRSAMEAILRPYDLGSTQWYVLWHVAHVGPMAQRDLQQILQVEKPTLSGVIGALVRKGILDQIPDPQDQRQRVLKLTQGGQRLWNSLPDPVALVVGDAFDGIDAADLATATRVLKTATLRLQSQTEGKKS